MTLDERELTRWFSKFLFEVESSGLIALLEDRDPLDNAMLTHLANTRVENATKSWLVEHPKPADGEETKA